MILLAHGLPLPGENLILEPLFQSPPTGSTGDLDLWNVLSSF